MTFTYHLVWFALRKAMRSIYVPFSKSIEAVAMALKSRRKSPQASFGILRERCLLSDLAELGDASIAYPAHKFV
jgi:hypothetical protein